MDRYPEFENRFEKYSAMEADMRKRANRLSNLRLLVFAAGTALSVFTFVKIGVGAGLLAVIISVCAFAYLIVLHSRLSRQQRELGCKAGINRMYMERLHSGWTSFDDCGAEFTDSGHPYTGDLDIFGPGSLFQWINISNTHYGRIVLKKLLSSPDKNAASIRARQEAVKELVGKLDFCQDLQCRGMLTDGVSADPEKLFEYAEAENMRLKKRWHVNLFYIFPFITILTFILWSLGAPVPMFIPVSLLTVQAVVFAAGYGKNSMVINTVYGMRKHLGAYSDLLDRIENERFSSKYLEEQKKRLFTGKQPASAALRQLGSIANAVDLKFSSVLYLLLNIIFLWDYHCAFALEEWKEQYGPNIRGWLETIGHIEALASLAVIGHMHPDWTYPLVRDGAIEFHAVRTGHPLIRADECVRNDLRIDRGSCVITGSNMSGKTTLLRAVGTNLVLAYAGAPVFAQRLECGIMDIFTSMRVHDDLSSGISTFYAELLRVKMIIDHSRKKLPMIFLIDEIFMGTNSADRTTGARSVLKNLSRDWIIGMISTHDFELCELEQEKSMDIKNYHFTEKYVNNEIRFDYRLRPGRSTTTNAKYLMKMVGIELEGQPGL